MTHAAIAELSDKTENVTDRLAQLSRLTAASPTRRSPEADHAATAAAAAAATAGDGAASAEPKATVFTSPAIATPTSALATTAYYPGAPDRPVVSLAKKTYSVRVLRGVLGQWRPHAEFGRRRHLASRNSHRPL